MAERRGGQPRARLDGIWDPERAEHRLERRAPAIDRGYDERNLLGRRPVAQEREQLFADELERPADARAFEEPNGAVDRDRRRRTLGEQRALELRERRRAVLGGARRELLRPAVGEA